MVSLLTYGCESWDLTPKAQKQINGANARLLAWFTGRSIPAESRPTTTSFNILLHIRKRRLRWVGHILRQGPKFLEFQALKTQLRLNNTGNLLMDAPGIDLFPVVHSMVLYACRHSS